MTWGALLLHGCAAHAPPPPPASASRKTLAPAAIRLAVLPPDPLLFSDVAAALDDRLARVQLGGAGPVTKAKVSMEVAQLALECVAPIDGCYAQVGKFLQVDRLLWGVIARGPGSDGLTVTVVLLDVGRGAPVGRAEGSFAQRQDAVAGLQKLVDEAVGGPARPATAALSRPEHLP